VEDEPAVTGQIIIGDEYFETMNKQFLHVYQSGVTEIAQLERVLREGYGYNQDDIDLYWDWKKVQRINTSREIADKMIDKLRK
jgi:hypothetical protein